MRLILLPIVLSIAIVACGPAKADTSADDAPTSTPASAAPPAPAEVPQLASSQEITGTARRSSVAAATIVGDITGVIASTGLLGGGTEGDVTLAVNTTVIQARVTGSCAVGSAIRAIAADGTVTCQPDGNGITYQRLTYSGDHSVFVANISVNTFLKIPNLQLNFTKASATSRIELTWNTLAYALDYGGGLSYCLFQLRVDDVDPRSLAAPGGGGEIAEYDNDLNTTEAQQVSATALWPSLAAGSHTISFWARSNSVDECYLGAFHTQDSPTFIHSVLVKETP